MTRFGIGTCVRRLPDGKSWLGWSIVPVFDRPEHLVGFAARNQRYDGVVEKLKWVNVVAKGQLLFNAHDAMRARGPLIICESVPNVLRFIEAGFEGAVATLGGALSDSQYGPFMAIYNNQDVLIASDNDINGRGQMYADATRKRIGGICVREPQIVMPPNGLKDFGDCSIEQIGAALRECGISAI